MRKVIILSFFLTFLLQVKSQNTEVEIYLVQNNKIVKGTVVASVGDSLRIRVDSLNALTLAKSELEGREFPVSKEVKQLRKKLTISESSKQASFPGIFQINKGQLLKGGVILILTSAGVIGVIVSGVIFVNSIAHAQSLWSLFTHVANSVIIFALSNSSLGIGTMWSGIDRMLSIKKMVYGRYYYVGKNIPLPIRI